jgi:hypothetical protein
VRDHVPDIRVSEQLPDEKMVDYRRRLPLELRVTDLAGVPVLKGEARRRVITVLAGLSGRPSARNLSGSQGMSAAELTQEPEHGVE